MGSTHEHFHYYYLIIADIKLAIALCRDKKYTTSAPFRTIKEQIFLCQVKMQWSRHRSLFQHYLFGSILSACTVKLKWKRELSFWLF